MKSIFILSVLAVLLFILSGCGREADFKSFTDTRANRVFTLGDSLSRFESNLVRQGVWVNERETADGTIQTRNYVYAREAFSSIVLVVDFLNERAVRITIRPNGFDYFTHIYMGHTMTQEDAEAMGFEPCPVISRRMVRHFDADGNEATADTFAYRAWFSFDEDGSLSNMVISSN